VFVVYLDDSDAEQSSVLTLAGYVSRLRDWEIFEERANHVYAANGVDVLHAKDFHGTKGCFKGWSRYRKMRFIDALYEPVEELIEFGLSRSVRKLSYRQRQQETGRNMGMSAYGVAFASIMFTVARGASISEAVQAEGVSFIVESGHNNNEEIEQYFHKIKTHDKFKGIVRSLTFSGKTESRAIQLADFYAFYSRRHAALVDPHDGKEKLPADPMFRRFANRIPHFNNVITNPYAGEIRDPAESDFVPNRPPGPLPSEVAVEPKRPKQRQRRRGRDRHR